MSMTAAWKVQMMTGRESEGWEGKAARWPRQKQPRSYRYDQRQSQAYNSPSHRHAHWWHGWLGVIEMMTRLQDLLVDNGMSVISNRNSTLSRERVRVSDDAKTHARVAG